MKVGVPKETAAGERRVALVPEIVSKLDGIDIVIEPGAGEAASFTDESFTEAGATLGDPWDTDLVAKVRKPSEEELGRLRDGQVLIGFLQPLTDSAGIERLGSRGVTAFAMESIPRITRAQSMDALSSQATVSGYKAVLVAADRLPKFLPMLMTAAGTVAPAKVLVIGAGVAGLQAIATARRLGAVVSGFDVRPVVKEQVESLGAAFLELGVVGEETEGGYARELSEDEQRRQQEELEARIGDFDVVDHHRAHPGPTRAEADPAVGDRVDAPRLGDRRPRGRGGRERRPHAARPGGHAQRRHDHRPDEPPELDAVPREPALRAQRDRARPAPRARGRARSSTSRTRSPPAPA